jgi:hypothetical protein|tara:strand:- start:2681 stop:3151 length:471 start_codon:yes stop_codon:yes gene_type:complete
MFGFGKGSKVTASIGTALHHQLYAAMKEDEIMTNERLLSLFTNGYISVFALFVYDLEGLNAQKIFEKNFRKMLDGVLPNRLDELFIKQNEMRKLAESMEDKSLYPEMYSGNQDPKYFTDAQLAAKEDAKLFVKTGDVASATGWYNYLTGKGVYSDV